jgi:outer membrane biosynthesis protein TonB
MTALALLSESRHKRQASRCNEGAGDTNGAAEDASIIRSRGNGKIDASVVSFVELNRRFLPALPNGSAIRYWTTVTVSLTG